MSVDEDAFAGIDDLSAEPESAWEIDPLLDGAEIAEGTDIGNAAFFARRMRGRLIFNHPMKQWMTYDGKRWRLDDSGAAVRLAKEVVREMQRVAGGITDETLRGKAMKNTAVWSRRKIESMMWGAQSELPADPSSFNLDPYALNLLNGTLDVRTRILQPHDAGDFITKLAPVSFDRSARCDRWARFIDEIMEGDSDLVDFLQRFVGLCLTGLTVERLFAILHGSGANGKTTLLRVMLALLGDYGEAVDPEVFVTQRDANAASPELVRLAGARFVSASELPEGGRLSESLLKRFTGNDLVSARALYCETIKFAPSWKIVFATNHRPVIRDDSAAFWDRLHLVPFAARFDGTRRDPDLGAKLAEELAGILNWALDGFARWQEHGLNRPDRISSATSAYRAESDVIGAFITDRCIVADHAGTRGTALHAAFAEWAKANGERVPTARSFRSRLREKGFSTRQSHGDAVFLGVGLLDEQHVQHPDNIHDDANDEGNGR